MSDVTLIEILRRSAIECAEENQPGWGNAMNDAAAALSAAEAEVERLKGALARWREDTAARLEFYLSIRKGGLLGTSSQIDVSLIMPTLAMLEADRTGKYDWSDIDALNVDDVEARARAALKEE